MQKDYQEYLDRKKAQYGDKFDTSDLAEKFVPFYESGDRIEVEFVGSNGEVYETKRGTVGVTTGWKPCFLLMLTKRSISSSYLLKEADRITKVKKDGLVWISRVYKP